MKFKVGHITKVAKFYEPIYSFIYDIQINVYDVCYYNGYELDRTAIQSKHFDKSDILITDIFEEEA